MVRAAAIAIVEPTRDVDPAGDQHQRLAEHERRIERHLAGDVGEVAGGEEQLRRLRTRR